METPAEVRARHAGYASRAQSLVVPMEEFDAKFPRGNHRFTPQRAQAPGWYDVGGADPVAYIEGRLPDRDGWNPDRWNYQRDVV